MNYFFSKGLLLAGLIFFISNSLFANELKKLSESNFWLGLVNYEKSIFSPSGYKSKVIDPSFFIDKLNGKDNPLKELSANINALKQNIKVTAQNDDYICRYPARAKWIAKKMNLSLSRNQFENCNKYQLWKKKGNIQSISLIFASGYFGNPASFFGHPLIKFNTGQNDIDLLSSIINYGAITPLNENPVVYVIKGLFGGYSGSFTHKEFFYNNHNYTEVEMRDLWEYVLDLDQKTIDIIIDHLWETVGKKGAYLFFTENCASKIDEKLSFILNKKIMKSPFPQEIPNVLFKNLDELQVNNKKIYKNIKIIPSLRSKLIYKYKNLNNNEQKIVKSYIRNKNFIRSEYAQLNDNKKIKINDVLLDYFDLQRKKDEQNKSYEVVYNKVIMETLKLNVNYSKVDVPVDLSKAPHKIHDPNLLRLKAGYSKKFKDIYKLNIRTAMYDNLTSSKSFQKNSDLKILDTHIRYTQDDFEFEEINLFSVSSMNAREIDLPGEFDSSWHIKVGFQNQTDVCASCLATRIDVGYGAAFNLYDRLMIYGLLSGRFQEDKMRLGHYEAKPNVGLFYQISDGLKFHLNYAYSRYLDKSKFEEDKYFAEVRMGTSLAYDFRLSYEKYLDEQTMGIFSLYW